MIAIMISRTRRRVTMTGAAMVGVLTLTTVPHSAAAQQSTPSAAPATASAAGSPAVLPPIQFKVLFDFDYVSQEPQAQPPNVGFGLRRARLFAQLNGPAGFSFRLHFDPTSLANGPRRLHRTEAYRLPKRTWTMRCRGICMCGPDSSASPSH